MTGTSAPDSAQGKDGDFYFNSVTFEIYNKVSGSWQKIANLGGSGSQSTYTLTLTSESDCGELSGNGTFMSGTWVTIKAEPYSIYEFEGWYNGSALVSQNAEYSFSMPAENIKYVARFVERADMANFEYVAGKDFCVITGVYDTTVTELVVPDCVTDIRLSAFEYCTSLQSLTLPIANKNLGEYFGATSPSFNSSWIPSSLKTVILSESVTEIGESAFENCSKLENIKLPSTIEKICEDAFKNTSGLNVYLSDIVAWCGVYFEDNPLSAGAEAGKLYLNDVFVEKLVIPQGVTQISARAFNSYRGLKSVVIPSSVKSIGAEAFSGCIYLTSVTIEEGVRTIGSRAFWSCTALTSLVIPNSVTTIAPEAIQSCTSLASVVIPSSVKMIGSEAFLYCSSLKIIYYTASQADWEVIEILDKSSSFANATVYFYSETQPTEAGNYWHYDVDGVTPVIW